MRAALLLLGLSGSLALAATTTTKSETSATTTTTSATSKTSATSTTKTSTSHTSTSVSSKSATSTSSDTTTSGTSTSGSSTSRTETSSSSTSTTSSTASTSLSNLPSLSGATVPTMVIPYTADAPFMQKSTLPEGTMFICIGAILGFLGLCVLAWRAMIAYTINRSVKRAALASITASDTKAPIWLGGSLASKKGPGGKMYKQPTHVSAHSLDALTSYGKKVDPFESHRVSVAPSRKEQARDPSSLFFSPTAAGLGAAPPVNGNRSSSQYLPAGYYAAPATQGHGGAAAAPESPSRDARPTSALLHPTARDDSRNSASWAAGRAIPTRDSALYNHPSTSSLAVGFGQDDDTTSGAYYDDEIDDRGHRARGRY